MPGQMLSFVGQIREVNQVKGRKMKRRAWFLWMKDKKPRAKNSFYSAAFRMTCAWSTRSCSKCWLEHWYRKVIMIRADFEAKYITPKLGGMCWHCFLTCIKEGDGVKEGVADLKETKKHAQDQSQPMDRRNFPRRYWSTLIGNRPMIVLPTSQKERKSRFYQNFDDSVVI